jgi:hypothetical protein
VGGFGRVPNFFRNPKSNFAYRFAIKELFFDAHYNLLPKYVLVFSGRILTNPDKLEPNRFELVERLLIFI